MAKKKKTKGRIAIIGIIIIIIIIGRPIIIGRSIVGGAQAEDEEETVEVATAARSAIPTET